MRKNPQEYYRELGLNPGATAGEIKQAYRHLLQSWHPDHFKSGTLMQTTAEDITKEINEAYEQLVKKQLYKKFLKQPATGGVPPFPSHAAAAYRREGSTAGRNKSPPPAQAKPSSRRQPSPPTSSRPPRRSDPPPVPVTAKPGSGSHRSANRRRAARPRMFATGLVLLTALLLLLSSKKIQPARDRLQSRPSPRPMPQAVMTKPAQITPAAITPNHHPAQSASDRLSPPTPSDLEERPAVDFSPPMENSFRAAITFSAIAFVDAPKTGVSHWEEASGLASVREEAAALLDTFEVGDFKGKVLAVQGAPDDIGENVYRYGAALGVLSGPAGSLAQLNRFPVAGAGAASDGVCQPRLFFRGGDPGRRVARAGPADRIHANRLLLRKLRGLLRRRPCDRLDDPGLQLRTR